MRLRRQSCARAAPGSHGLLLREQPASGQKFWCPSIGEALGPVVSGVIGMYEYFRNRQEEQLAVNLGAVAKVFLTSRDFPARSRLLFGLRAVISRATSR